MSLLKSKLDAPPPLLELLTVPVILKMKPQPSKTSVSALVNLLGPIHSPPTPEFWLQLAIYQAPFCLRAGGLLARNLQADFLVSFRPLFTHHILCVLMPFLTALFKASLSIQSWVFPCCLDPHRRIRHLVNI
jgi:hypothetical protein